MTREQGARCGANAARRPTAFTRSTLCFVAKKEADSARAKFPFDLAPTRRYFVCPPTSSYTAVSLDVGDGEDTYTYVFVVPVVNMNTSSRCGRRLSLKH